MATAAAAAAAVTQHAAASASAGGLEGCSRAGRTPADGKGGARRGAWAPSFAKPRGFARRSTRRRSSKGTPRAVRPRGVGRSGVREAGEGLQAASAGACLTREPASRGILPHACGRQAWESKRLRRERDEAATARESGLGGLGLKEQGRLGQVDSRSLLLLCSYESPMTRHGLFRLGMRDA